MAQRVIQLRHKYPENSQIGCFDTVKDALAPK